MFHLSFTECSLLADPSGGGLRARAFAQMGAWKEARKAIEEPGVLQWTRDNIAPSFPMFIDLGARQASGSFDVLQLMGGASVMQHVIVPDDMGPLRFESAKLERKALPGRGQGLVAKANIAEGELLIASRPIELIRPGDQDWQYHADMAFLEEVLTRRLYQRCMDCDAQCVEDVFSLFDGQGHGARWTPHTWRSDDFALPMPQGAASDELFLRLRGVSRRTAVLRLQTTALGGPLSGSGAMSSDLPAAVSSTFGREPNPPMWDGVDPGINYPIYVKNVQLWQYETEVPEAKQGVRLLRGLSGVARAVCDGLEFEQIASEKGVKNILDRLKEHFSPHLEVSLPRAFERAIYGAPRGHKEDIQEYLIRMERAFFMLAKEGVNLPDQAVGYVIFRQASLSEGQELRFGAWAQGKYDKNTVIANLRKLDKVVADGKQSKSSVAFIQDDAPDDAGDYADGDEEEGEDNYVYLTDGDLERVFEEPELQVILSTYQEVKRAIQSQQKGRQFAAKGKGKARGSPWKEYTKDKRKVHIEQLKLRTRCARCGAVGHWARECKAGDDRARSSAPPSSTKSATQSSSASGGQSWYVSSGAGSLSFVCHSFSCECGGYHTHDHNLEHVGSNRISDCVEDETSLGERLRGNSNVFVGSNLTTSDASCCLFVGLTTCPTMAIVDTAAQDGLVGEMALQRLKGQLEQRGLQIVHTNKKAKAHGVGGQAQVVGIAAVPLGIAGTTGILEVTVVKGDVPLLLPIKLLKDLKAVIDLEESSLHFKALGHSVELHTMPSGHVAIDVLQFGPDGFVFPQDAVGAAYRECDFRLVSGSEDGCVMLTQSPSSVLSVATQHVGRSVALPACFQSPGRRCGHGGSRRGSHSSPQESSGPLEDHDGQSGQHPTAGWTRGIGALLAATSTDFSTVVSNVIRAVSSGHRHRRAPAAYEVQGSACEGSSGVPSCCNSVGDILQPVLGMDHLLGLSLPLEGGQRVGADGKEEDTGSQGRCGGQLSGGQVRGGDQSEADERAASRVCSCSAAVDSTARSGETADDRCAQPGDERNEKASTGALSEGPRCDSGGGDDERVCGDGDGKERVHRVQGLPYRRDVCLGGEGGGCGEGNPQGDASAGGAAGTMCRDAAHQSEEGVKDTCQPFTNAIQGLCSFSLPAQEAWVSFAAENLEERIKQFADGGQYEIKEVFVEQEEGFFKVEDFKDLAVEDKALIRVRQTARGVMEEWTEDVKETSLPKALKTKLRRAASQVGQETSTYAVDVSEV
eukprot:s1441_g26.t1